MCTWSVPTSHTTCWGAGLRDAGRGSEGGIFRIRGCLVALAWDPVRGEVRRPLSLPRVVPLLDSAGQPQGSRCGLGPGSDLTPLGFSCSAGHARHRIQNHAVHRRGQLRPPAAHRRGHADLQAEEVPGWALARARCRGCKRAPRPMLQTQASCGHRPSHC